MKNKRQNFDPKRAGRLFWILSLAVVIFVALVYLYVERDNNRYRTGIASSDLSEEGQVSVEVEPSAALRAEKIITDDGRIVYATRCSKGDKLCEEFLSPPRADVAGTVVEISSDSLTYEESEINGNPVSTPEVKTVPLSARVEVSRLSNEGEFVNVGLADISVGDKVVFVLDDEGVVTMVHILGKNDE